MRVRTDTEGTSFVLRYPRDWGDGTDPDGPFRPESAPWMSDGLFHDRFRHVTELRPMPLSTDARPPSGLAVEPGGDAYRVDREGRLVRRRCDGTEVPFPCEPDLVRRPAGLALDRRGWLYVADPGAQRVVVLDTRSGSAVDVLSAGAYSVDVAVSAIGSVAVADRSGLVWRFSATRRPIASFAPRNAAGLPVDPRPIAVMFDADGRLLVADARYPRVLAFLPDGTPAGELELTSLAAGLPEVDVDALQPLYGVALPVFLALRQCGACPPDRDGPTALAAVHLAVRVARLCLDRSFATEGVHITRRLDGGAPGTGWQKVVVDADVPPGTRLIVETATTDAANAVPASWEVPRDRVGRPVSYSADVPDQFVQSPAGRYLWLRTTLESDGTATPSLRALRVHAPRHTGLDLLPRHWQRDTGGRRFLQEFLALVEGVNEGMESRYEQFLRDLNPDAVPMEWSDWLGGLIDLTFDPSWPIERRRALIAAAMELYRSRGTPAGIRRYVQIYTGIEPVVLESFLGRPRRATVLGVGGGMLGCDVQLCGCAPDQTPDEALYRAHAHRFTVVAPVAAGCDVSVTAGVVRRIVEMSKPAHTVHTVELALPDSRVGIQARVGIDLVLGADSTPAMRVVPSVATRVAGGVLGRDSVLGDRGTGASGSDWFREL